MSNCDENKESTGDLGLTVDFVHRIDVDDPSDSFFDKDNPRGHLSSITPMVCKVSVDGSNILSVTFGCAWASGNASVFNIALISQAAERGEPASNFNVSESIFVGDRDDDVNFYDSKRVVVSTSRFIYRVRTADLRNPRSHNCLLKCSGVRCDIIAEPYFRFAKLTG
jgi:hypothetical protein